MKYATLIPTKTRPKSLSRLFKKCPDLNSPDTFIGIEPLERSLYATWRKEHGNRCTIVNMKNPAQSPGGAREQLRIASSGKGFDFYILADDNCSFSSAALSALLAAAENEDGTAIITGSHSTGTFFHKDAIEKGRKIKTPVGTLTLFPQISFMFWAIPAWLYDQFSYPEGCGYMDDSALALWCITQHRFRNFIGCAEARYDKHRHELQDKPLAGYYKAIQVAKSFISLAEIYPELITPASISTKVPYSAAIKKLDEG